MVSILSSNRIDLHKPSVNIFEVGKTGLSALEHQLTILFSDLQELYQNTVFTLEGSGQPWKACISQEDSDVLFRILLEATDNSLKHSRATHIQASIKFIGVDLIQCTVSDNGVGFDLDKIAASKRHSGIKRICHATHQIGGRVVFNSSPGKGSQVVIAKPIEKQKARFYTRLVALF